MTCTLVTAFYPIRSKFTEDTYIRWATSYLTLEAPILLFTTPELADRFRSLRGGRPLHILTAPFSELDMWKRHADTWVAHYELDAERAIHSPELYAVWAQKSVFMRDASILNPFQTEYFFWCDIGAFRGPIAESVRRTFPMPTHLPKDRLLMSSVDRFRGLVDPLVDSLVGGLWGGTGASCCRWYSAFNAMLLQYIEKGMFAVFYPQDIHRPCMQIDGPEKVKKVVVKVRV